MTNPRAPSELAPMAADAARLKPLTAERVAELRTTIKSLLRFPDALEWASFERSELEALLAINDALRDGRLRDVSGAEQVEVISTRWGTNEAAIFPRRSQPGDTVLILPARKDGP